jgi:hypothetical protein
MGSVRRTALSPRVGPRVGVRVLVVAAALAPALPSRADVVVTTDGRTLEGKVVSQDADLVVVETTFDGRQEVARASVKSVDTSVPPLREQLAWRTGQAKDAAGLLATAEWARKKGFRSEVDDLHHRVLETDPQNARARKALGHVKVGGRWMTPEEKAEAEAKAAEAEMLAKGLVRHDGRWVTPEEKAALEKGLRKDGDDWVTEDEWHRRRGERKVDGKWVRVGEAEGQARAAALSAALATPVAHLWAPHVDVFHEIAPADAQAVLDAAERAHAAVVSLLAPGETEPLRDQRVQVLLFDKATPYARFAEHFAKEQGIHAMPGFEAWAKTSSRQKSFWWTDPVAVTAHTLFPNPAKVLASGVVHNLALVLLNRHRFAYRWNSTWLQEGFAYHVELATLGYSDSYTVGRGGAEVGDPAPWQDAKAWRGALREALGAGKTAPMPRLAEATLDRVGLVELVKAWSVVDLLVALDRAKFKAFVDGTKARGKSEEDALREAYGLDYEGLEARWRAYVAAGFKP